MAKPTAEFRDLLLSLRQGWLIPVSYTHLRAHETGNAYEEATLIQSQSLQSAGLPMEKYWLTSHDDRVSDGCMENEDVGWIPLDDAFPSGDMRPLRFPGCRCALETRWRKEGR